MTTKMHNGAPARIESDSMGKIEVPADKYYGAQSARSLVHFDIGDGTCLLYTSPTRNKLQGRIGDVYKRQIFKGPNMCGPKLGSFHTIWDDDYPVDATSTDAVSGTIAVGVVQDAATGVGSIELCTLKSGCKGNLLYGYRMNAVFAVAMNKRGDCWASSAEPTALTYFKGCSGSGQLATGYALSLIHI